jgi:hypothetical protein
MPVEERYRRQTIRKIAPCWWRSGGLVLKNGRSPARPRQRRRQARVCEPGALPQSYLLDEDAAPPDPLDEAAPLPEPPLLLDAAPPLLPDIPPLPLEVAPEPVLESDVDDGDLLVLLPPLLPGDTTVSLRSWHAESAKTPKTANT